MYFFYSLIIILLILLTTYLIIKSINNVDKKILNFIFFTQVLFMIFGLYFNWLLVFLDFALFIAYFFDKKHYAIYFSIINILYLSLVIKLPICFYFIYPIYFIIYKIIKNKRVSIITCLLIKSFLTSFTYTLYFDLNIYCLIELAFLLVILTLAIDYIMNNLTKIESTTKEDETLYQVVHEIKNPLSVCSGYLEMLDTSDEEKLNKYLPIIKKEMNRALTIMNDFLNIRKIDVNKEIMDLTLLIDDVKVTMGNVLKNNIEMDVIITNDEIYIDGDYDKLKQVLINLIKNSYEANATKIELKIKKATNKIELVISDNGKGISESDLNKIGSIYFTTKETGNGLGVNLSKEILKKHNATIKYESKLGYGTSVKIIFPIFKF